MLLPYVGKPVREKVRRERTVSQVSCQVGKGRTFKRFKPDLDQVVVHGKNTDDLQYVRKTDSYSHLFACYLLSVYGTFIEGHKSASHCMAGNEEVMGLWAKFSSESMTKQTAEEHLIMAYERT